MFLFWMREEVARAAVFGHFWFFLNNFPDTAPKWQV
jgi:hypothetical protein